MPIHQSIVFNRFAMFRWEPTSSQWQSICKFAQQNNCRHYFLMSVPAIKILNFSPDSAGESFRIDAQTSAGKEFSFSWSDKTKKHSSSFSISDQGYRVSRNNLLGKMPKWNSNDFIHMSILSRYVDQEHVLPAIEFDVEYVGKTEQRWTPRVNRLLSHHRLPQLDKRLRMLSPTRQLWVMLLANPVLNACIRNGLGVPEDAPSRLGDIDQVALEKTGNHDDYVAALEAGLIKLFMPKWNRTFKGTFPSKSHRSYRHFYTLDLSTLGVEIHMQGIPFRLKNTAGEYRRMHGCTVQVGERDPHWKRPDYGPSGITDEELWSFMPDGHFGGAIMTCYDSNSPFIPLNQI